jgi:hypothetical protein
VSSSVPDGYGTAGDEDSPQSHEGHEGHEEKGLIHAENAEESGRAAGLYSLSAPPREQALLFFVPFVALW